MAQIRRPWVPVSALTPWPVHSTTQCPKAVSGQELWGNGAWGHGGCWKPGASAVDMGWHLTMQGSHPAIMVSSVGQQEAGGEDGITGIGTWGMEM